MSTYTVWPRPSTTTVPSPETSAVLNVVPGDDALDDDALDDDALDEGGLDEGGLDDDVADAAPEETAWLLLLEELQAVTRSRPTPNRTGAIAQRLRWAIGTRRALRMHWIREGPARGLLVAAIRTSPSPRVRTQRRCGLAVPRCWAPRDSLHRGPA
ncbi:MAG TPA: hypothetical protein VMT43_03255 [Acidimicrobiales bacterium]|nr:hypothetical protein [Acidimicrobiales bacterium]